MSIGKLVLSACIMAGAMNAQDFHGVSIGGTNTHPTIINQSDKPVIGYAARRTTTTGIGSTFVVLDFDSLASGRAIQPGEERWFGLYTSFRSGGVKGIEGEPVSYEVKAVLFADGSFYGPSAVLEDFRYRISIVRDFARTLQHAQDKRGALIKLRSPDSSQDPGRLQHVVNMANVIQDIGNRSGGVEVDAALTRLVALPDAGGAIIGGPDCWLTN